MVVCIVAPARVIALDGETAVVDLAGRMRRASLLLEPEVQVGDWVIVGSGAVLRRLDAAEAAGILDSIAVAARDAGDTSSAGGFR